MDSAESYWICKGTKQEPHPEFEVEANLKCDVCGQEESKAKSRTKPTLPLGFIAGAIALLLFGGIGAWWFSRDSQTASNNPSPTKSINAKSDRQPKLSTSSSPLDYSWQPARFTKGQRTLFSGNGNPSRDNGIEAFRQEDYGTAIDAFKRAKDANRNDPEVVILYKYLDRNIYS